VAFTAHKLLVFDRFPDALDDRLINDLSAARRKFFKNCVFGRTALAYNFRKLFQRAAIGGDPGWDGPLSGEPVDAGGMNE